MGSGPFITTLTKPTDTSYAAWTLLELRSQKSNTLMHGVSIPLLKRIGLNIWVSLEVHMIRVA